MLKIFNKVNIPEISLILLSAIFIFLSHNQTLFNNIIEIYPVADNRIFIIFLVIIFFSISFIEVILFSLIIPTRILLTFLFFISASFGYFSDQYGVVFDDIMFVNIFQSNVSESLGLVSHTLLINIILFAIIPSTIIWNINVIYPKKLKGFIYKLIALAVLIILIVVSIYFSSANFASFIREHKALKTYAIPSYPIYSLSKIVKKFLTSPLSTKYKEISTNVSLPKYEEGSELVVLIIGETARADHFSLNGYDRPTNPYLGKVPNLISYTNVESCGTTTAVSVPCMFSYESSDKFNRAESTRTENILDTLMKANVNILWRDNNSDSKHVADRVTYQDFKTTELNPVCNPECRDEGMLHDLDSYIDSNKGNKLIVLHQMGSHGPEYFKRYPKKFEKFTPACQTNELNQCTRQEIINAYDNTILYTDYFLHKTINFLKSYKDKYEVTLIYVSDHGESLGENGIYLHGMPKSIAPASQTHIPLIIWGAESTDVDIQKTLSLRDAHHSHDKLPNTLLELFEVTSNVHDDSQSKLIYRLH